MTWNLRSALALYLALKRSREAVTWATELAEYFWHPSGRPLRHEDVAKNLDAYNEAVRAQTRAITKQMIDEQKTLGEWQDDMKATIGESWRINYMAGRGGRRFMTQEDWGRVGGQLGHQFNRLTNFANDLAAGQLSEAQAQARAALYTKAPRQAHQSGIRAGKAAGGFTEERRNEVMDAGTCGGCADWHSKGWQPINTLPPPGSECECGANCRGEMEFRGQAIAPLMTTGHMAEMFERAQAGGFTYHPGTGTFPTEGLAFSAWKIYETPIPLDRFGPAEFTKFVSDHQDKLYGPRDIPRERRYIGGWIARGNLVLDVSAVLPVEQFDRVVRLCYYNNQEGFFDIGRGQYHDTLEEWAKLQERIGMSKKSKSQKKKVEPVKMTLIPATEMPHPDKDPEAFEAFAKKMVNHFRAMGGLEPAFDEEGNEIPGRIKRD